MNVEGTGEFLRFRPPAGSPLYRALEARIAAVADLDEIEAVVVDLWQRREVAQAVAEVFSWDSDVAQIAQARAELPVYDELIAAAENEKRTRLAALGAALAELQAVTPRSPVFAPLPFE
jgi:hypothetical protein